MAGTGHRRGGEDGAVADLLRGALEDPETGWTLGSFGALALFQRARGEEALPVGDGRLGWVTPRGAIALAPQAGLRPLAYETAFSGGWNHAVALCLPAGSCAMTGRRVLTELGPDAQAGRDGDRAAILFDLGLGLRAVDACIRTADPDLLAVLRAACGETPFGDGNRLLERIAAASPHRVFITRIGRIEVFAPIPGSQDGSPAGPRTHLLPGILRAGRTHAATTPIPPSFVPCGALLPPHPCKDATGRPMPFSRARHEAFQRLLEAWGDPVLLAAKRAAEAGEVPPPGPGFHGRYLRAARRAAEVQAPYLRGAVSGSASLSRDACP